MTVPWIIGAPCPWCLQLNCCEEQCYYKRGNNQVSASLLAGCQVVTGCHRKIELYAGEFCENFAVSFVSFLRSFAVFSSAIGFVFQLRRPMLCSCWWQWCRTWGIILHMFEALSIPLSWVSVNNIGFIGLLTLWLGVVCRLSAFVGTASWGFYELMEVAKANGAIEVGEECGKRLGWYYSAFSAPCGLSSYHMGVSENGQCPRKRSFNG